MTMLYRGVLRSLSAFFYVVESSKVGRGLRRDAHSPLAAVATRKQGSCGSDVTTRR